MARRLAAVTGATGFLGRRLVRSLADDGWEVRVLARRDPIHSGWRGLEPEVVIGDLADRAALERLCRGAAVLVHAAGLIKARSAAAFAAVNEAGARRAAAAADRAGVGHMLLVSSLAAREPRLSDYAASKRAGEAAATAILGERLTIVRPPVIYGPGDVETFRLFRAAERSPILPTFGGRARIAVIHVHDAARQIAALAGGRPGAQVVALSDSRPEGYAWREIVETAAAAVGVQRRIVPLPGAVLTAAGLAGAVGRLVGRTPMLTPGKARELRHLDWSLRPDERCGGLPPAQFRLGEGFAHTVDWCRRAGWFSA